MASARHKWWVSPFLSIPLFFPSRVYYNPFTSHQTPGAKNCTFSHNVRRAFSPYYYYYYYLCTRRPVKHICDAVKSMMVEVMVYTTIRTIPESDLRPRNIVKTIFLHTPLQWVCSSGGGAWVMVFFSCFCRPHFSSLWALVRASRINEEGEWGRIRTIKSR